MPRKSFMSCEISADNKEKKTSRGGAIKAAAISSNTFNRKKIFWKIVWKGARKSSTKLFYEKNCVRDGEAKFCFFLSWKIFTLELGFVGDFCQRGS